MDYELTYAHTIEEGAALAERVVRETAGSGDLRVGFDTEFYDVELGKHSVLGRAKVHLASIAWNDGSGRFHPRGFTIPRAAVVSRDVVTSCEEFRALFEKEFIWLAHNAPVDVHCFRNEGINVRYVVNTLTLARWAHPGRAARFAGGRGFGLDALGQDFLGEGKLAEFDEIFSEVHIERKPISTTVCECGAEKCRKRSGGHSKIRSVRFDEIERNVPVPLQQVVPGHPIHPTAVRYAATDAVLAKCYDEVVIRELQKQERVVPWLTPRLA